MRQCHFSGSLDLPSVYNLFIQLSIGPVLFALCHEWECSLIIETRDSQVKTNIMANIDYRLCYRLLSFTNRLDPSFRTEAEAVKLKRLA